MGPGGPTVGKKRKQMDKYGLKNRGWGGQPKGKKRKRMDKLGL